MKHIKKFENFEINEENIFRKFTTGHETKEDKAKAESRIISELEKIEIDMKKSPEKYAQSSNWERSKKAILDKAKENSYRGKVIAQKGGRINKLFVIYKSELSPMQDIAIGASARTANPLGK